MYYMYKIDRAGNCSGDPLEADCLGGFGALDEALEWWNPADGAVLVYAEDALVERWQVTGERVDLRRRTHSNGKITPGPWRAARNYILAGKKVVAQVHSGMTLFGAPLSMPSIDAAEADRNARAIAALPELIAAVRNIVTAANHEASRRSESELA